MNDDTEDLIYASDGLNESEYVEVEGAQIIAPKGWSEFADYFGAVAVRVNMAKGGSIDVLIQSPSESRWSWKDVAKPAATSSLKSIKPA